MPECSKPGHSDPRIVVRLSMAAALGGGAVKTVGGPHPVLPHGDILSSCADPPPLGGRYIQLLKRHAFWRMQSVFCFFVVASFCVGAGPEEKRDSANAFKLNLTSKKSSNAFPTLYPESEPAPIAGGTRRVVPRSISLAGTTTDTPIDDISDGLSWSISFRVSSTICGAS